MRIKKTAERLAVAKGQREAVREKEVFMNQYFDSHTKAGTAGGTLLSIFANIHSGDILKTAILAAIGAAVSFFITLLLKIIIRYFRK